MNPIRTAGTVIGVVTGLWAVYVSRFVSPLPTCSPCVPAPSDLHNADPWLGVVGAILVLASLAAIGVKRSFLLGAILSAIIIARVALLWGTYPATDQEAAVVLSAVTLLVDAIASLPAKALSEKDSPLNLPVFG